MLLGFPRRDKRAGGPRNQTDSRNHAHRQRPRQRWGSCTRCNELHSKQDKINSTAVSLVDTTAASGREWSALTGPVRLAQGPAPGRACPAPDQLVDRNEGDLHSPNAKHFLCRRALFWGLGHTIVAAKRL